MPIEGILGTNKQTQTDFCGLRAMLRPSQVRSELENVENVRFKQYCFECSLWPPLLSKNVIKLQRQMNWALLFFCSVRADIFAGKRWMRHCIVAKKEKEQHFTIDQSLQLRYECHTLQGAILYKELSSPIFQSLSVSQSVRKASVTPVQISTLCNI